MEDFAVDQARYLSGVLAANAKHIEDQHVGFEHFSVHPISVMDQAQTLQVAVRDNVALHKEFPHAHDFVVAKSDFSLLQNRLLGIALQDRAQLHDSADNGLFEVQSIRPPFVNEMAEVLESVVRNNAEAATGGNFDISKLDMCQPWEVANQVKRFRQLLEHHIHHLTALTQSKNTADQHNALLQKENENLVAQCTSAQMRIAELEGGLGSMQQELEHIMAVLETEQAAKQAHIDNITKQYESLQSGHHPCAGKLLERDFEVARLKDECKKLITDNEERTEAANNNITKVAVKTELLGLANVERAKLATDLSELQASYEQFRSQRAQEIEQLVRENALLQETLQKRVDSSIAMEARNTELNRTISQLESDLRAANTQLMNSELQCDTWKAALEDMLPRHQADLDAAHSNVIRERELREAGDALLQNAVHRIEYLEQKQREQIDEIARLREVVARKDEEISQRLPISPPASTLKPGVSSLRKRKATAAGKGAASWSQDDKGFALNLAAHGSPIPPGRAATLASLPPVVVNLGEGETPDIFTRQSLSNILGGSLQGLVVRCTNSATDLARRYEITDYLCPNMDHNPWSPPGPGQHGYMQVGLGRDRKLFNGEGEYRHVFVGGGKFLLYCGWYHVLRVDPLTREEWDTLPPKVKATYSETTFHKENTRECTDKELWCTIKNADQVLAMYNQGELRAPLVRLQCVRFDMDFYQELLDANGRYFTNKQRPAPPSAKRRKVTDDGKTEDDDKEEDIPMALIEEDKAEDDGPSMPLGSITSAGVPTEEAPVPSFSGSVSMHAGPVAPAFPTPVFMGSASFVLPPSSPTQQTRYGTRLQTSGGLVRLRIPGGKSPRSGSGSKDTEEEREVEDGLSSESDDDDMYAD